MTVFSFIAGFAGGVFGTAIGALPSFIFVGFFILVGVAIQAAGGTVNFLDIPLGPLFGPHVGGWAAGCAAASYAAKQGKLSTGRDVATPLMSLNSPDVLLVGGIFGILGVLINWVLTLLGGLNWTDTIALTVVLSHWIARLIWGNGLFGQVKEGISRFRPDDGTKWLLYQSSWPQLVMIGLGAGLMSAWLALTIGPENGGVLIGFAFSAISLTMLQFGQGVPVTHHITLVAAVAAAASGSIIWGGIFGVAAAFAGELFSRIFLIHGNTHIDPPATTIATGTSLILGLNALGVFAALALF
jgi:hypothetical protein